MPFCELGAAQPCAQAGILVLHQTHIQLDFLGNMIQLHFAVGLNHSDQMLLQHRIIQIRKVGGHDRVRFQLCNMHTWKRLADEQRRTQKRVIEKEKLACDRMGRGLLCHISDESSGDETAYTDA